MTSRESEPSMKRPAITSPSVLFVLAGLLPACGGGAATGPSPPRGEIDQIASAPLPTGGLDDRSVDVPSGAMKGAPAEVIEVAPASDPSPWGAMLTAAASARPGLVVASGAMACV